MASNKKKYGLILASARRAEELRSAAGKGAVRKINVLRTSDDELEEDDPPQGEDSQHCGGKKRGEGNSAQQAQQLRLMREALEEDPSIFMYDEHYDDLKAKQTAVEAKKQQNNEPKYIGRILQSAQRRQLERERCAVRKVQKERDAEQGFFDDKESFVTPAYVKKLEEIRQAEAQEKIMEVIEEKNEAMRDRGTSLFYKDIFNQRLGGGADAEAAEGTAGGDSDNLRQGPAEDCAAETSHKKRSRSISPGSKRIIRKPNIEEGAEKSGSHRDNSNRDTERSDGHPKRSCDDSHMFDRDSERPNSEFKKSDRDSEKLNSGRKDNGKDSSRYVSESNISKHATKEQNNERNSDRQEGSPRKSSKFINCDEDRKSSAERDCDSVVKKEISSSPESATESLSKFENGKSEAETKEDRVARLFAKRTVGTKFIEAQQRYLQRKEDRSSARGGL